MRSYSSDDVASAPKDITRRLVSKNVDGTKLLRCPKQRHVKVDHVRIELSTMTLPDP